MKKSTLNFSEFIPIKKVNLDALRRDIDARRQQYQHEAFARLLNIERPSFTMKLSGTRGWKFSELIIIASRLGRDYQEYLKEDSNTDAAS